MNTTETRTTTDEPMKSTEYRDPRTGKINERKIKSFKDLFIWQEGIKIVQKTYQITSFFPKEELYGLTSQMRRCAVSVPSNIAEGFKRWHSKEFKQHLNISLASLAELETQITISDLLGYVNKDKIPGFLESIDKTCRMIVALAKKL